MNTQLPSPRAVDLLTFASHLRTARSAADVEFLLVNEAFSLLRYDQAFLWKPDVLGRPVLAVGSGLVDVDANAPFALWFSRAVERFHGGATGEELQVLTLADFPESLDDGAEWIPGHACLVRLKAPGGEALGGIWFGRAEPFSDEEKALVTWLGQQGEFALWAWRHDQLALQKRFASFAPKNWLALSRRNKVMAVLLLVGVFVFPVRLSALAPAEVSPLKPLPVTSPVDGVVAQVLVTPNQAVRAQAPLVEIDDTSTRNRLLVAQKTLDVARADFSRAAGKAFADDASKAELQLLDARVRERTAEVAYLTELLSRLKLVAPGDGIALFANSEDWRGKPVQVGERIMTVADQSLVALTIYVSPDDAITLDPGAEVKVYLNISPLDSYDAAISQSSYETGMSPEGHPAFVVKAGFGEGQEVPRLGLKGTAKIYAGRVPLAYYLLRRPLRIVRSALGI